MIATATTPDGEPRRRRSKRLTAEDREKLTRFAIHQVAEQPTEYRACSAIIEESRKYGDPTSEITRRVARGIYDQAMLRLSQEIESIEPHYARHVIYRLRELFAAARDHSRTNTRQAHHYLRICAEILKTEGALAKGMARATADSGTPGQIIFRVVKPEHGDQHDQTDHADESAGDAPEPEREAG